MSNPDSFIDEVTEEVRRDRLFALLRKYGWIGVVAVVAIVGGAAWNEWSKARFEAEAQAFGDALLEALDLGGEDRASALAAVTASGKGQAGLLELLRAAEAQQDKTAALAALEALAADADQPQIYRDLAVLRRVILAGKDLPLAERRAALDTIAVPGRPFRPLALEQLAYLLIEDGKTDDAIAALTRLAGEQDMPQGLKSRAGQVVVALGGTLEPAAPAPADEPAALAD